MISYVRYLRDERIIAYDIVERDSNQNCAVESRQQQRDNVCTLHFEHLSKWCARAGSCTLDRTMKQMGSNPYANCFSSVESCVFDPFVTFAIHENYLANYVQKLQ